MNSKNRNLLILLLLFPLLYSCGTSRPELMTQSLFMQRERINIHLPSESKNENKGSQTITENVTYTHSDNTSEVLAKEEEATSITDVQRLDELVVTAKARFTPERKGMVNVDFMVYAPKELLSENWQLVLSPKLIDNDSVVELDKMSIKGQKFNYEQQASLREYDRYVNSIVSTDEYDQKFVDQKQVDKDLKKLHNKYLDLYAKEYKEQEEYLTWKNRKQKSYDEINLKRKIEKNRIFNDYMLKKEEEVVNALIQNKDTTGLHKQYVAKFENFMKKNPVYDEVMEHTLKNTPKKYRKYFEKNLRTVDADNFVVSAKDSLRLVENRYKLDAIAENELKKANKDRVYQDMVLFPPLENAKLDTIITRVEDFVYLYELEYPVTSGLNSLRIVMDGEVQAVDESTYRLAKSDTLSYFISSLVQLVDTSLIRNETKVYKNMYNQQAVFPNFTPGQAGFDVRHGDNAKQIEQLKLVYDDIINNPELSLDSIQMKAHSMSDNAFTFNDHLSDKRLDDIEKYLTTSVLNDMGKNNVQFKSSYSGDDLQTLTSNIRNSRKLSNRAEILSILKDSKNTLEAEKEIKSKYPTDYAIITNSIYPKQQKIDFIFSISRPGMEVTDSIHTQYSPEYEEGVRLLQNREYAKAFNKLKSRPDYNAALALVCLGYNGRAYDLLVTLDKNANTEYLMALALTRMNRESEAVDRLLSACEYDPLKVDRATLDPELSDLIKKYGLEERLEEIYLQTDVIDWGELDKITNM